MRPTAHTILAFVALGSALLGGCSSACSGAASGSWDSAAFCGGGGGGGGGTPPAPGDPRTLLLVEGAMIEGTLPESGEFAVAATSEAYVAANHPHHEDLRPVLHDSPSISLTAETANGTLFFDVVVRGSSFGELPEGSYESDDPAFNDLFVWFGEQPIGAVTRTGSQAVDARIEIDGPPEGRRTVSVWAFVYFQDEPIHAVFDVTEVE